MWNFDINFFNLESNFWPVVVVCFALAAFFLVLFILFNFKLFSKIKRRHDKAIRTEFHKKKQQDLQIKNIEKELKSFLNKSQSDKKQGHSYEKTN